MAQPVPFTNPQPFARAAVATVLPQPQDAGQTLEIGPGLNGGSNYTVSAAGETWANVYLGIYGTGTLNHSAGTLTITNQIWLGYASGSNGTYNLSGTGVLSAPTEIIGYSASAVGTFNQNGGTNKTPGLNLAPYSGSSGTYSLNGGTLQAGSVTGNGSGSVFDFNGGTLQATVSTGSFLQGLTYTNVQTGGAFIDSNGYNVTVAQSLLHDTSAGAPATDGGLTKLGAGTLTFTGNNNYRGTTTINAGTLAYGGTGGSSGGGGFVLGGGNLVLNGSGTVTASGVSFTNGASSLTLQAGNLQIAAGGTISGGGGLIFQGGTLQAGGAFTISGGVPISIQAGGGTVDTSGGNITSGSGFGYSGGAAGRSSGTDTFTVQGGHVLQADLTSNSGWTGPTVVTGSGTTLRNNGGNYTAAGTLTVGAGAFYDLNNSGASFGGLAGAGTVLNTGGANSVKTLTLTGAGNTFSGSIAPAGGATEAANTALTINLNSDGVETLTGNNTYTGVTTINAGTLQVGYGGTSGSLGTGPVLNNSDLVFNRPDNPTQAGAISGSGRLFQSGGGTLILTGNNTYTGTTFINAGTLQVGDGGASGSLGTGAVGNNAALVFNRAGSLTQAGVISGGGSLTLAGNGTLILTGNNAYTGATTISAGFLQVGNGGTSGSLGTSTGAISDNGTLAFNHSDALTIATTISGTGGFIQQGSGTLTLLGNNTYMGGTYINAGTLQVGNGGTSGSLGPGMITNDGALVFNHADNLTEAAAIFGGGTLTQAGSGTLTLTGYAYGGGTTYINAGTLQVGNGGTSGSLGGGTGAVVNNTALVFNLANNLTQTGAISGGGTLTQAGSGTLTLTGSNTYTGATTISAGTLQVGNGGTAGSLVAGGAISDNGTLAFNHSDAVTLATTISGTGGFTQAGSGTLTLTGNNTYTGATTISAGTLQVGNGGTSGSLGTSTGAVVNNAALVFDRADNVNEAGVISGSGTLTQAGNGTLTLTGNNTYAGTTYINAGTLQVGNGGTSGSLGASYVLNNGALVFNRADNLTEAGTFQGSGTLTQAGSGTLTLTGYTSLLGAAYINAGHFAGGQRRHQHRPEHERGRQQHRPRLQLCEQPDRVCRDQRRRHAHASGQRHADPLPRQQHVHGGDHDQRGHAASRRCVQRVWQQLGRGVGQRGGSDLGPAQLQRDDRLVGRRRRHGRQRDPGHGHADGGRQQRQHDLCGRAERHRRTDPGRQRHADPHRQQHVHGRDDDQRRHAVGRQRERLGHRHRSRDRAKRRHARRRRHRRRGGDDPERRDARSGPFARRCPADPGQQPDPQRRSEPDGRVRWHGSGHRVQPVAADGRHALAGGQQPAPRRTARLQPGGGSNLRPPG